jgi:hypothetical protein
MLDFERMKQDISGHSVLITSWYDDSKQDWRANAPDYSFLSLNTKDRPLCASRKEAIQRMTSLLANHFANRK